LRFRIEGTTATCETSLPAVYQGWRGIAHGGIVMALIDEAMAYAAGAVGWKGVTAEVTTRFRHPVPLETPLRLVGRVMWERRNVVGVEAEILGTDGTVLASGEGKFVGKARIEPGTLGRA
jgi:acyl-coenzyme A thioesterase PaaI-like protein